MSPALPPQIAIDGPAASGKTTIGRALAKRFGYTFLDTGLMYRAFTLAAHRAHVTPSSADACGELARSLDLRLEGAPEPRVCLGDEDVTDLLRAPEVEAGVSGYSAVPAVREVLVGLQRAYAERGNAILAGRDIGTVVLPRAALKLFLAASESARADRRRVQAESWGTHQDVDAAKRDISRRDQLDSSRKTSPLAAAPDAVVIDTTALTFEQSVARAMEIVRCWHA